MCIPKDIGNWGGSGGYKHTEAGSMWQAILPGMPNLLIVKYYFDKYVVWIKFNIFINCTP